MSKENDIPVKLQKFLFDLSLNDKYKNDVFLKGALEDLINGESIQFLHTNPYILDAGNNLGIYRKI